MKKHVIQIRLDDSEYNFLKRCAVHTGKSMSQTLLYMADFYQRMEEEHTPAQEGTTIIQGVEFSHKPFDDYDY